MFVFKILIVLFLVSSLVLAARKEFGKALRLGVFLMIALPKTPIITLPGALPNFSAQRISIIVLWICYLAFVHEKKPIIRGNLSGFFVLLLAVTSISTFFSADFVTSFKQFISLVAETFGFYLLLTRSLRGRREALGVLFSTAGAIVFLTVLAFIEHYFQINPFANYYPDFTDVGATRGGIVVTYPHRILLGYALVMGVLLLLGLHSSWKSLTRRYHPVLWAGLAFGACFFTMSRGPWMAALIAMVGGAILGASRIRRQLLLLSVIAVFVLIMKPGVYRVLSAYTDSTLQPDPETSVGSSYQYRWELWRKAHLEISKSAFTFAFGYGPGTTETLDLAGELSYSSHYSSFWSWDNHYAALLFETGVLGLGLFALLHLAALWSTFRGRFLTTSRVKPLMGALAVAMLVYVFAMTNVKIFSPQLTFLFWSFYGAGQTFFQVRDKPH